MNAFRLGYQPYPDWFLELRKTCGVEMDGPRMFIQTPSGSIFLTSGDWLLQDGDHVRSCTHQLYLHITGHQET